MAEIELWDPETVAPGNGYSQVVSIPAGSRLVWLSGQVPVAPDGTLAPAGDWEAQARQVFRNIGAALEDAGAGWADVVKFTYFVTDAAGLPTVREVRDEYVNTERPPTSTAVRVAGLIRPEFLLEVEAIAAVRE